MITNQGIKTGLARFDIGDITKIVPIKTTGNKSYKIVANKGEFFLRLSPNDAMRGRSRAELIAEIEFLDYLQRRNLPIHSAVDGKIISIDGKSGYIRQFDRGGAINDPTTDQITAFGELLGKMHRVAEGFKPTQNREHIWNLVTTKQNLLDDKKQIGIGFVKGEEFYKAFKTELFGIKMPKNLPKGMIHEDLGKRHVLWQGGRISSVIDFDRCYVGYFVDDLGQAIRGWCFNTTDKFNGQNYQALLSGYKKARELSKNEVIALPQSVKFAFLERSLSYVLRGVHRNDKNSIEYAQQLLAAAKRVPVYFR